MSDERKTVRVRVLVRVDAAGQYLCEGWGVNHAPESELRIALDENWNWKEPYFRDVWVEADVPLPEPLETVEGEVTDA